MTNVNPILVAEALYHLRILKAARGRKSPEAVAAVEWAAPALERALREAGHDPGATALDADALYCELRGQTGVARSLREASRRFPEGR